MKNMQQISIIEDNDCLRHALKESLIAHGFGVLAFRCAEDFLTRDSFAHMDLILSDVDMVGMDGFQLVRLLKKQNNNTPVILMSGSFSIQKENALGLGAVAFIAKPFGLTELLKHIQGCISDSRPI
jgi:DNA-binding NtrC family response regulator